MYRFLKKTQYVSKINLSSEQSSINQLPLCSFCKIYHWNASLAIWFINKSYFGTKVNDAEVRVPIKKKSRIRRKYVELLEVTEKLTSNKKAPVKKLDAAYLSTLINQSDVSLDKLNNISDNYLHEKDNKENIEMKDYINVSTDVTMLDNLRKDANEKGIIYDNPNKLSINYTEDIYDTLYNKKTSILNELNNKEFEEVEHNIKSDIFKSEIDENISLKNKLQIKNIVKNNDTRQNILKISSKKYKKMEVMDLNGQLILAQIDVYLACKMFEKVQKLLKILKNKINDMSHIIHRDACNIILEFYSSDKNLTRFLQIYNYMINNSIIPDPQTYAAAFDIISTMKNKKHQADLFDKFESDMISNDISFHDIFNMSKFIRDQSKNILKTIRFFRPEYQPEYSMPQMSYNCKLLNRISEINSRENPVEGLLSLQDLKNSLMMQINQENRFIIPIKSVEKFDPSNDDTVSYCKQRLADLESSWREVASKAFEKNLKYLEQKEHDLESSTLILYPFLKVLPTERYINIILQEIRNLADNSESFFLPLSVLYVNMGFLVYREYEIYTKKNNGVMDKVIDIYNKYLDWYCQTGSLNTEKGVNSRIAWSKFVYENQHYGASLDKESIQWPYIVCINIGKFLYQIIINDIKINTGSHTANPSMYEKPAFYTLFRSKGKNLIEQIKPHPNLHKLYKDTQSNTLIFEAPFLPSLCPPRPWISVDSGGYTFLKTNFVRIPYYAKAKQIEALKSTSPGQLFPAFDNLNQLGSVPWKINTDVLDILIKVFQDGGSVKLNVPESPSILLSVENTIENINVKDNSCISKTKLQLKKKREEMYSLWCDCLYKLSVANHYRNNVFWLPHNLDFRGRVYPVPPHLTHLGSDLARSIMIFAQKKPLGPNGLDWLKIHTINLSGLMKRANIKDRLKFANDNIDKIVDSAEHPLTGDMWWAESAEPWQTLASCIEITKALKSPNTEEYLSGLPIHQDGSCNGLQHYAALGRDQIGAENVNLQSADTPQDIYSVVVNMVEDLRSQDAEKGVLIAKLLEGHINRKVIKQTIMTTVYGVTKYGARLQILKQLKDLEKFPQERSWEASTYLTYKTFDSLRTMFKSARAIQDWFTNCAYIISTIFGEPVEWITPLGFPVIQPYSKCKKSYNQTNKIERVDTLKQKNSFPPNFIHSLDSTHMMLTSLFCEQNGMTFMSVHDCYWSHPCTIDLMNKICREQFVALHSEPILDNFSKYLHERYLKKSNPLLDTFNEKEIENIKNNFNSVPEKGSFKLENVLNSVYFFS
ncbi:DNA-directed RNA polymerase, mitochondrial-like isoform X1 [Vespa mandarinia]|uniref:DNA-directed RNA polymerase, mitochondrial-like isoform X1 n=2 Tax=Vespa mandarinia TaxID=7446 RepID=UPI00161BE5EC|nr:DNA-directed RNA polymerase, mitochondrial-like isoform X1 [Vespa mandarinia]